MNKWINQQQNGLILLNVKVDISTLVSTIVALEFVYFRIGAYFPHHQIH